MAPNKIKWLHLALVLSFLTGYLEWGQDQKKFIFQLFVEILKKAAADPSNIIHPFILLPLFGFIGILYTLFQATPSRILTLLSIGGMAVIILFIFFIGVISVNVKMIVFNLPFVVFLVMAVLVYQKKK